MNTSQSMKATLNRYVELFNQGDAEAVTALYAEDATVEDPVGSPLKQGRVQIHEFYVYAISTGAKLSLDCPARGSHGDSAAIAFTVMIGSMKIQVIDVMQFNPQGLIISMRAFFGPDDIENL